MDCFVRRENVRHYRELLKTAKDKPRPTHPESRGQQKQKEAGDKIEE